jgi:hypothetical protein
MTTKELKCADLVADKLEERELEIKELMNDPDNDENDDFALSINTDKLTTVCLSWGGPSDYLEIIWFGNDHDCEIKRVTYRYSDWFDTATVNVPEDSPLYEYARNVIEWGEI